MKRSNGKCRQYLSKKIGINMDEYRRGMYVSPAQAIAVAYSQVRKSHPACKRYIKKKKSKRSKRKSMKKRSDGVRRSRKSSRKTPHTKLRVRRIKPESVIRVKRTASPRIRSILKNFSPISRVSY